MERDLGKTKNVRRVHIAPPSTATEIMKAVGASKKDVQAALTALHEVLPNKFPNPKKK